MRAYRDQYAEVFNGGEDVVLIAISADPVEELASWAQDEDFPFLMASDTDTRVGGLYGARAAQMELDNRNLFVVGPDGRIAYRATPFRQVDPQAYAELGEVIDRLAAGAADAQGSGPRVR